MDDYLTGLPLGAPKPAPVSTGFVGMSVAPAAPASPCAAAATLPKLELEQANGRITRLIVTCGCGERLAVDCVYDR